MKQPDDYLWDRNGVPEADVEALERLLAPLAHQGRPLPRGLLLRRARPRWRMVLLAAAAALLAVWLWPGGGGLQRRDVGRRFVTAANEQRLRLGEHIAVELLPGSELRLEHWDDDLLRLQLTRGSLRAVVAPPPAVAPRFFQVATPAVVCIDLGCRYELGVAADGATHVLVTEGAVAFATGSGREIFVPAGARCRLGAGWQFGTPAFTDSERLLLDLLEKFDFRTAEEAAAGATSDERRKLADRIVTLTATDRDTLILFGMLSDPDPTIREFVEKRLIEMVDLPESARQQKGLSAEPAVWLEYLRRRW